MSPESSVVDLRSQIPPGLLGSGNEPLRLTWQMSPARSSFTQLAYEIETSANADFAEISATSGVVESSDQIAVSAPGPAMRSREIRHLRVRVSTEDGWSDWSPVLKAEAGLLEAADWVAQPVTLPDDPGSQRQSPSPLVRREFDIASEVVKARLYVTSVGVHRVSINGTPVSDEILNPGWSSYRHRLLAATYDVTSLLRAGPNVIAGVLGDGWYRGRLGWDPTNDRCRYGTRPGSDRSARVGTGGWVAPKSWPPTTPGGRRPVRSGPPTSMTVR